MSTSKWHFTPLSNDQKAILCILAREAFDLSLGRFAIDDGTNYDDWRREQQLKACGVASLTKADQSHFLYLRGHWFVIIGNLESAFQDFLRAGEQNEAARQMKHRLLGQVALLAEGLKHKHAKLARLAPGTPLLTSEQAAQRAWAYAQHICRDQFKCRIEALDAKGLENLGFSCTNRANDMLGKGKPENRNKSQRAGKRAKKPAEDDALEPFERHSNRDEQPYEIELTQPLGEREPQPF